MRIILYLLVACLSCVIALGNEKMEYDRFEKTKAFLMCQVPLDSDMLLFSNGFRSFHYDARFSYPHFDINKYARTLENNQWEKINESGWTREGDIEQIIYIKNNIKYIVTKEKGNTWRELVINDKR